MYYRHVYYVLFRIKGFFCDVIIIDINSWMSYVSAESVLHLFRPQLLEASWAIRVMSRISEVVPDGLNHSEAFEINWVKRALAEGDIHARLLHWRFRYEKRHRKGNLDPGTELQAIRDMREMCLTGYYPAALTLSHFLATSR